MILAGCEPNTSIVNNSADGCLVSLTGSGFRLKSISIKNKNSHVVGTGSFLADYIVPEDGSVVVDLEYLTIKGIANLLAEKNVVFYEKK